jgi:hypothetical protein
MGTNCADHTTPLPLQKLALTSPTSGGLPVDVVRWRTKCHGVHSHRKYLSGHCGSLNTSQRYRSPRLVTGRALLPYIYRWHSHLTGNIYGLPQSVKGILHLLYVDDFRTSQETSMDMHSLLRGELCFLIYIDDIRTSQETSMDMHSLLRGELYFFIYRLYSYLKTHPRASTACNGNSFTSLYVHGVRTSQEKTMGMHSLLRGQLYF